MAYRIGTQIPGRNYSHWQYILDELKSNSLSIGQAGHQSTSFQLNVNVRAWDFENVTEATVALMQATTVIIGTDTGLSHLAALLSKPLICFRKEDGSPNMLERFAIPYLQQKNKKLLMLERDGTILLQL